MNDMKHNENIEWHENKDKNEWNSNYDKNACNENNDKKYGMKIMTRMNAMTIMSKINQMKINIFNSLHVWFSLCYERTNDNNSMASENSSIWAINLKKSDSFL